MGYYTDYKLHVDQTGGTEVRCSPRMEVQRFFLNNREVIERIIAEYKPDGLENYYDFDYVESACVGGNCKWYHHEGHMRRISEAFPTIKFILEGVGEGDGMGDDVWLKTFQNGSVSCSRDEVEYFDDEDLDRGP
jgi:hypothetical protein